MIKQSFFRYILFVSTLLLGLTACSNDVDEILPSASQGQVCFQFKKIKTWGITQLEEMRTVKLILERDGVEHETASLSLSGTEELISTRPYILEQGIYKVISYKVYDKGANMLLDVELDENNVFEVKAGGISEFALEIKIKETIINHTVKNSLFAICVEAFGTDSANWPPTWRNANPMKEWKGLEFEEDDYGNLISLIGLTLDESFAPLKRLPSSIKNLQTLEHLIIRDNALEELPSEIGEMYITMLTIINTNLSTFPASMSKLDLHGVLLQGNKLTTYPEFIATQKNLNVLHLIDENISEIPAMIATNTKLRSLVLRDLQLSSLPDVFDQLFRVSTLDISGNKNITSLPASIQPLQFGNQLSYLHGLNAKNCGFTQIPQEVISSKFVQLNLSGNPLTSVSKADIEAMTKLDCLELNNISFTSFPVLEKESMRMLSLINTGLTPADVDRSGMPNLYSVYSDSEGNTWKHDFLFFTQEQYDAIFASNLAPHSKTDLLK